MRAMHSLVFSALGLAVGAPLAHAQVSVNAVITGQVVPGVYGQVVIGNGPPPPVLYAEPVIAQAAPVVVGVPPPEPIYLHVPPGHAQHWRKHCHEYHACDRPVYFVRSAEYEHDRDEHGDRRHHDGEHGDHNHGHHDD